MVKKDNIKPYDGGDAYYEGTDSDYEDFLKNIDGSINAGVDVGSENQINPGETINLKNVLNIVKKKAGELGTAAKKVTDDMREQLKTVSDTKKADESPVSQIGETARAAKEHLATASADIKEKIEDISNIAPNIDEIHEELAKVTDLIEKIASKQNDLEVKQIESKNNFDRSINDLRSDISGITSDVSEVKQTVNLLAKLNDSIFDLKNTQQNIKNAIADLKSDAEKTKKKITAGITAMSILAAITIALQVINILS